MGRPIKGSLLPQRFSIPLMLVKSFEEKDRGDLDQHFHQSISPLSERNLLDLDFGVLSDSPPFFFLSYLSIVLVA
jgi:hypothetical protein